MRRNLQHAIERVERPGGSHEGVGRKKTSDEDEVIACINSGIGMASTKKRENTETQKSHCHTVV